MALILHVRTAREQWWQAHLQSLLPEIECRLWSQPGNLNDIRYAVVWAPPAGGLRQFKNLQFIVSIGAGIDHVLADPQLPMDVPIIRTTGAQMTQRMREYVCLHVLRLHRGLDSQIRAQSSRQWHNVISPSADQRTVGVMGLGKLGAAAAATLVELGFRVRGWARSPHDQHGVYCFSGADGLADFLSQCEILVCMLPLTAETDSILNRQLFEWLPTGAHLINVGRGEHLHEDDLLAALATGQLGSATLDVFRQEPLPANHPFWVHPAITITPHIASMIDPETGGQEIARNLQNFVAGQPVADLVDARRGY